MVGERCVKTRAAYVMWPEFALRDEFGMTNRNMVNKANPAETPNTPPLPPMPAPEDASRPTTREDPIDSPQPNASAKRDAPSAEKQGLATKR